MINLTLFLALTLTSAFSEPMKVIFPGLEAMIQSGDLQRPLKAAASKNDSEKVGLCIAALMKIKMKASIDLDHSCNAADAATDRSVYDFEGEIKDIKPKALKELRPYCDLLIPFKNLDKKTQSSVMTAFETSEKDEPNKKTILSKLNFLEIQERILDSMITMFSNKYKNKNNSWRNQDRDH